MRKNNLKYSKIIILILGLFLFCGCAAERTIQDNRFYSSSPEMLVKVGEEFNYLGSGSSSEKIYLFNKPNEEAGKANVDFYIFIPKDHKDQIIRKGVIVSIHNMETTAINWGIPLFDRSKESIYDHGVKLIGNENYEYVTMSFETRGLYTGELLYKKNILLPVCVIAKRFACKVDEMTKKQVTYFEDAELSGFSCKQWENMKQLSNKQLKFIDGFDRRANRAIQINSVP